MVQTLLTISGLDPSAGAGLSQDLAVFAAQGFHGVSAPTALVVQGPRGVRRLVATDDRDFALTLDTLAEDIPDIHGVKIGAITSRRQVEHVVGFLCNRPGTPIVVDPVLRAKNGTPLTSPAALEALSKQLLPHGAVVTPNLDEAEVMTGRVVRDISSMREAARAICAQGARAAVVTGGHLDDCSRLVDVFSDGISFIEYESTRLPGKVHGTGCLFSALLLSYLARDYQPDEAFLQAEERTHELMAFAHELGPGGYSYVSPGVVGAEVWERSRVLEALREAAKNLAQLAPVELVPAVQMNLGFALPWARRTDDVAAFPGRIGTYAGRLVFKEEPAFGASSHVARLILSMMRRFPHFRSCLNLRLSEECLNRARSAGLTLVEADRQTEPSFVRDTEGMSLDFLMELVLVGCPSAPDIVYDRGEVGKEPLIRLFGRTPADVLGKLEVIRP